VRSAFFQFKIVGFSIFSYSSLLAKGFFAVLKTVIALSKTKIGRTFDIWDISEKNRDSQKYRHCKLITSRTPADFLGYHFHIHTFA